MEGAMADDVHLMKIMRDRREAQAAVDALAAEHKLRKAEHKKSFWSLWKAECRLAKEKIKHNESVTKWKAAWQKRCWQLYKILKIKASRANRKKD